MKTSYNKTGLLKIFQDGIRPDEIMTVSEFSEKNIYLPENMSEPGLINLDRTPYMRKPLDDLTPGNKINKVVFMGSVQLAKSNMAIMFALAMMFISPGNTMFVFPRISDAHDFAQERLSPMIQASPVLKKLVKSGRNSDNKIGKKTYRGGFIYFAGSNSAASFRSRPIRYMIMDETDEYPQDVEGQGNPISLAINRTISFKERKKIVLTSTPTDENSHIYNEFLGGTQEHRYLPCPHCGHFQKLDFRKGLKYKTVNDEGKVYLKGSVFYECEACQFEIKEAHKGDMSKRGEWRADNPDADYTSYHLNALHSPWLSWDEIVKKWIASQSSRQELKVFINTYLAEIFEEEANTLEPEKLFARKDDLFKELEIDPKVIAITVSADTQDNRLAVLVKGWGKNEESWNILYKELYAKNGDMNDPEMWENLKNIVYRPYIHPSGVKLYARGCAIDVMGHYTSKVYDFVMKNPKFFAIKGSSQKLNTLLAAPSFQDVHYQGNYAKNGVALYNVGTDIAKEEIYHRLRKTEPGAGYIHFNKDLDLRYFEMLVAEKQVTKYTNGYPEKVWKNPKGKRNEALDVEVYNFALAKGMFNLDMLDDVEYEAQYKKIFGDYGIKFILSQKPEEERIKAENQKKLENIEQVALKKMPKFKNRTTGFMGKYRK